MAALVIRFSQCTTGDSKWFLGLSTYGGPFGKPIALLGIAFSSATLCAAEPIADMSERLVGHA